MKLMGDGSDEALADAREGEGEEDDAGEEDGSEGCGPGDAHTFDDGVGEVGVKAHAGREGEGVVGDCTHEDGAEGGAKAGGGGDRGEGHASLREDGWVDEDDVGHSDEGGKACDDLGAPVGVVMGEAEVLLQAGADGHQGEGSCSALKLGRIGISGVLQLWRCQEVRPRDDPRCRSFDYASAIKPQEAPLNMTPLSMIHYLAPWNVSIQPRGGCRECGAFP
jgi:hypothetical protein